MATETVWNKFINGQIEQNLCMGNWTNLFGTCIQEWNIIIHDETIQILTNRSQMFTENENPGTIKLLIHDLVCCIMC